MLNVITPDEAKSIIMKSFCTLRTGSEPVSLGDALGRVLSADISPLDDIPGFTRSTVDGYALRANDTFGCSDAMPAFLSALEPVEMGKPVKSVIKSGQCAYVPTGGQLPEGSDCAVMVEHTENYGDGTIGILKPAAPGQNCIFKGDDAKAGSVTLHSGKKLLPHDIGALAAMGIERVEVGKRPKVGILSTGDELIPIGNNVNDGQVRDVNSHLLTAAAIACGGEPAHHGICPDDTNILKEKVLDMIRGCDIVLLSGGTSVGSKDAALKTVSSIGKVLFHGVAMRPGKPTLCGEIQDKPVFCLPGHPVAAYFTFRVFVSMLINSMLGQEQIITATYKARLASRIPSNHGREEYIAVRIEKEGGSVTPIIGKSGLISLLSEASGYIKIERDQEGLMEGETVDVIAFD